MKVTRKEYLAKWAERRELVTARDQAKRFDDFPSYFEAKNRIEEMDQEYFDKLPRVKVAFSVGQRSYYESVVKIGKSYFQYGQAMTQGRGYYGIEEIPEITEEMKKEMIDDSYYY